MAQLSAGKKIVLLFKCHYGGKKKQHNFSERCHSRHAFIIVNVMSEMLGNAFRTRDFGHISRSQLL